LRTEQNFNGYIHLKAIPGASPELLHEAGIYADRLSVNIEIPSDESLRKVAPEKNYADIITPMNYLADEKDRYVDEKKHLKKTPIFLPGGQSTQLIIGASPENDSQILHLAGELYKKQRLKRVYYSGYIPIQTDSRVPSLSAPPLLRENRMYQADWLLRFYKFAVDEIVDEKDPNLALDVDPKLNYALRHPEKFPIDINTADYEMILRVPGIGVKSAMKIVTSRIHQRLHADHLKRMGIVWKRARYFITCNGSENYRKDYSMDNLKQIILASEAKKVVPQLNLFG